MLTAVTTPLNIIVRFNCSIALSVKVSWLNQVAQTELSCLFFVTSNVCAKSKPEVSDCSNDRLHLGLSEVGRWRWHEGWRVKSGRHDELLQPHWLLSIIANFDMDLLMIYRLEEKTSLCPVLLGLLHKTNPTPYSLLFSK